VLLFCDVGCGCNFHCPSSKKRPFLFQAASNQPFTPWIGANDSREGSGRRPTDLLAGRGHDAIAEGRVEHEAVLFGQVLSIEEMTKKIAGV
jgi:hypothetical protein